MSCSTHRVSMRGLWSVAAAGALVGAVMLGGASLPSATAATTEAVGCGPSNTASPTDLQNLQQDIATLDGGSGPGTIELAANCTYSFTAPYSASNALVSWYGPAALPAIASNITIDGQGATIQRDPSAVVPFRLFFVGADPTNASTFHYTSPGAGNLTLQDLTLNNGEARGGDAGAEQAGGGGAGMGGAIFNQGQLSLNRVTIMGSTAQGGNGSGLELGGSTAGNGGGVGGNGFGAGFAGSGSSGGAGGPVGTDGLGQAGSGGGGGGFRSSENGANGSNPGAGGAAGSSAVQTGTGGVGGAVPSQSSGGTSGDGSGGGGAAPSGTSGLVAGGGGGAGGGFGSEGTSGGIGTGPFSDPYSPGGGGGGGGVGESGGDGYTGGAGGAGGGGGFGGGGGSGGPGGTGGTGGTLLGSGADGGTGGNGGAGGFGGGGGGGGAGGAGGIGNTSDGNFGAGGAGAAGGLGGGTGTVGVAGYSGGGGGGAGMGGAVFNDQGQVTLDNSTLSGNTAQGGIGGGFPSIVCCVGGNGQGLGGAIFNLNGSVATDSATIAFNTADGGGGIYNLGYAGADSTQCAETSCGYAANATVVNSIVSNSTSASGPTVTDIVSNQPTTVSTGATNVASSNVYLGTGTSHDIVNSSAAQGVGTITGTAPITTDPWTAPVSLNANTPTSPVPPFTPPPTLAIDPSSPAYNTGATSLTTDERGVARPSLGADDIGAFEYTLITPTLNLQAVPSTAGLGDTVQAQATLSGGSQTTGTVTFNLYDQSDPTCSSAPIFTTTDGLAGGTATSVSSNPLTVFGTYRWQASYSGDTNDFPVTGNCGDATVVVGKATPTLNAGAVQGGVVLGSAIQDAATLNFGYNNPSGTITFNLYGPTDSGCTAAPVFTSAKSVVNEAAESDAFTPTSAGTYHWIASYGGDTDNNAVSGSCGDANQTVTVAFAPALNVVAVPTQAGLTDALYAQATLIGGKDNPTGTVTFTLSPPGDNNCFEKVFSVTVPLSSAGTATAGPFTPNIDQVTYPVLGTYSWLATYNGDSNNPKSVPLTCGAVTVDVGKANSALTAQATPAQTTSSKALTDTATFSQMVGPDADVTFDLYDNSSCAGSAIYTSSENLFAVAENPQGQYVVTSGQDIGAAHEGAGTYYWVASYPGDGYNNAVSTTCGVAGQTVTVTNLTPTLTISQLVPAQTTVGNGVQAQATLGGGAGTGRVFFDVYGPNSPGTTCDSSSLGGSAAFLYAIDGSGSGGGVDGDGVYTSDVFTPTAPGTYFWEVHYTADNRVDNSADEVCGPHGTLTVGVGSQSISASASTTSTSWANQSMISSSGYSGTGLVSYSLDDGTNGNTSSSVCSLSGTTLSATGPGTCSVYASIAADTNYLGATSADVTVTFTQAAQGITALASPAKASWANTSTVSASGYTGTGLISYSLDDGTNGKKSSSVCSLSGTTVSATYAGNCFVYATIGADANYLGATSADVRVHFKTPDLSITDVGSQNTVTTGSQLTYTIKVTNTGHAFAYGVKLTDVLPSSAQFASASTSQGRCGRPPAKPGVTVTCHFGSFGSGRSATVTIVVTTTTAGTINDSSNVAGYIAKTKSTVIPPDSDDSASATTTVQ